MALKRTDHQPVVHSTEHGRICKNCGRPVAQCACTKTKKYTGDGVVRIRRETQGRGGKVVTTIAGVSAARDELMKLASELKKKCGAGGAVRDGVIEIQGDHREKLFEEMETRGFNVKLAGG